MRTAAVTRFSEGWRVSCKQHDEVLHTIYFYDEDFKHLSNGSFSMSLGAADFWIKSGLFVSYCSGKLQ